METTDIRTTVRERYGRIAEGAPESPLPLLDLSDEAFAALSHLSRGVLRVSVVPA